MSADSEVGSLVLCTRKGGCCCCQPKPPSGPSKSCLLKQQARNSARQAQVACQQALVAAEQSRIAALLAHACQKPSAPPTQTLEIHTADNSANNNVVLDVSGNEGCPIESCECGPKKQKKTKITVQSDGSCCQPCCQPCQPCCGPCRPCGPCTPCGPCNPCQPSSPNNSFVISVKKANS